MYWIRKTPIEGKTSLYPESVQAHCCINYDWNHVCIEMKSSLEELIRVNPANIELIIDPKEINKILMTQELLK